ncbi:MAG: stalk domain-containing protein [Candidatus Cryosericum sp.]
MKRLLAISLTIAMVFSLLTGVAGVRAADLGMHITSPIAGGTITTSTFNVNGSFDAAQSNSFKLLVTVAGFGTHTYNFAVAGATTWSVAVNMADFPGMVNATAYATTLQGATAAPSIPPVQTDPTAIVWNVGTIVPPVGTMTGALTDSAKVLTLNYFNPVAVPPTAGTPVALASQYIYKMGDVIHGTVTFHDVVAGQLYTVQLKNMAGAVIDTVNGYEVAGLYTYPIQIGTANVSFDGPYDVVVGDANEFISLPVGGHVFIQYNLTWKTKTINSCSGFNTIEGWITRGNGQTVLVPVTVGITYPDNTLAASYVVAAQSSGQFSLTFPVNPATQIGSYRVFIRDGYNPPTIPDNDAMIYEKLSNVPADLAITASTYGSPILLYKNQVGQPVVLALMDNNGMPVTGASWTLTDTYGVALAKTVTEISPGYYRFVLAAGSSPDVRFQASKVMYLGLSATYSNMVIVSLRDLGAFNPYLDINATGSFVDVEGSGRLTYDALPCTIGNSLWVSVGYHPIPASMVGNWYIDAASVDVTINGPIRESSYGSGRWIIEKAGKITASISMNVWERIDTTVAWPQGGYDLTNACCHSYSKNFDVCEVKSCTTVGITLAGANITDESNITVGKSADLVISVSGANAPAGLFCGCNTKIVRVYMVDGAGRIIDDAFTAKTWGGASTDLTELWYNGITESVGKLTPDMPWSPDKYNTAGLNLSLPDDGTVQFKANSDVNVIDNCEKLTFKDITFNYVTDTDCYYNLVVEIFGLYRTFDACGNMMVSYPFISETLNDVNVNPVVTTLSATATVYEMGVDPTDILAGVPATIEITDPKFSTATGWGTVAWSAKLGGTKLSTLGITMTPSSTNTGLKFTFSCAFPKAGDLVITGYHYYTYCAKKEVATITLKVVMPTFDVKIGLLDGTKIENDHIITEGFGELIYVTATDPRADGHHDFSTDPNWTLTATAVSNACGLPTSTVCYAVPAGCTTPSPISVSGLDNPHIEDAPQFKLYFVVGGCAKLLVDTFTFASSTVKVSPTEVAFTIPASATHVVFSVMDAHGHGAPGVDVTISGTSPAAGASGYSFTAGSAKTDKNGEADWAFVPPYSGLYKISAGITSGCAIPASWYGISASAKITAVYKAPEIDTTAPVVKVADGIDGKTFAAAKLALTGKVTDNVGVTQLFVGMNKVDVLPDGSFMTTVMLAEGENSIAIVAYDASGNKGTQTIKVTYKPAVDNKTVLVLTIGADIVSVNGKATSIDAAPEIVASRTFVPMRFIAESFGATVEWLPETQGITITLGDTTIGLQIGNSTAVIDGTIVSLSAAPYIKNGRTMVPLRVISEAFGGDVVWEPVTRTITITYRP